MRTIVVVVNCTLVQVDLTASIGLDWSTIDDSVIWLAATMYSDASTRPNGTSQQCCNGQRNQRVLVAVFSCQTVQFDSLLLCLQRVCPHDCELPVRCRRRRWDESSTVLVLFVLFLSVPHCHSASAKTGKRVSAKQVSWHRLRQFEGEIQQVLRTGHRHLHKCRSRTHPPHHHHHHHHHHHQQSTLGFFLVDVGSLVYTWLHTYICTVQHCTFVTLVAGHERVETLAMKQNILFIKIFAYVCVFFFLYHDYICIDLISLLQLLESLFVHHLLVNMI